MSCRVRLIDHVALIEALKSGRPCAWALDVYEEEEGSVFSKDLSGRCWQDDPGLARMLTFPNVVDTSPPGLSHHEALNGHCSRSPPPNMHALMQGTPFVGGSLLT